MRKIVGSAFLSLDGVMQAPGGRSEDPTGSFAHGGWVFGFSDTEIGPAIARFFARPYDLLLGRRTYDIFAAYWPYLEGDMAEAFTRANKYVLTGKGATLDWVNSHALADIDAVAALKAGDGPDLLVQGSSTLYPALLRHGLLDRVTTMTFPVLLGAGKRLFGEGTPPGALRLVGSQATVGGVVIATWEPAGPVPEGGVPSLDNPREAERQRRMREGVW